MLGALSCFPYNQCQLVVTGCVLIWSPVGASDSLIHQTQMYPNAMHRGSHERTVQAAAILPTQHTVPYPGAQVVTTHCALSWCTGGHNTLCPILVHRWSRRQAEQAAYVAYMNELRRALGLPPPPPFPSPLSPPPDVQVQPSATLDKALSTPTSPAAHMPGVPDHGASGQLPPLPPTTPLDPGHAAQMDAQLQYQVRGWSALPGV